ncbi:hypothetical protein J2S96_003514 [Arthrobacter bambusae]|nr:hypothetical protein [Arthrobacter bambusae]
MSGSRGVAASWNLLALFPFLAEPPSFGLLAAAAVQ